MEAIRALCGHVIVMNAGMKIAEGTPDAVLSDPKVMQVYLGTKMLRLEHISVAYGKHEALHDVTVDVAAGARRQSWGPTAPARARFSKPSPAWCGRNPAEGSCSRGARSKESPHTVSSRPELRWSPKAAACSATCPWPRISRSAPIPAPGAGDPRRWSGSCAVSRACRTPPSAGQDPERRRAADAGDRAGPDGNRSSCSSTSPRSVSARAYSGALLDPAHHHPRRAIGRCWSSRTCITASAWPIMSMCWKTAASSAREPGGAPTRQGDPAGLSRALTAHRRGGHGRRSRSEADQFTSWTATRVSVEGVRSRGQVIGLSTVGSAEPRPIRVP